MLGGSLQVQLSVSWGKSESRRVLLARDGPLEAVLAAVEEGLQDRSRAGSREIPSLRWAVLVVECVGQHQVFPSGTRELLSVCRWYLE